MAAQPASSQPAPSAQVVGNAFVEQYYHILHRSPELVFRFYQDTSLLSRPDPNGHMTTVTTMKDINEKICSLDYKNYKAEIKTADAQGSYKDGVVVLVTGCLTGKDNLRRKFTQTFFLAPQDKGYYVYNDIFRYVEESEPYSSTGPSVGTEELPLAPTMQDLEPPHVVEPIKPNHATAPVEEVETINAEDNRGVADEGQVILDQDIVVEAKSHINESPVLVAAEEVAPVSQEDAPKKSYASIVTTKKGPTKIYVPANTKRVASTKAEKPSINPPAEAQNSEASAPSAPVEEPESNNAQDEVEGHSIYIRNLPMNVTVSELEAEFKKFGPIKQQNGVQVRSNKQQGVCFGFVEFLEFSSMQDAIKASPIAIGDRQASVEIKRTTTRVGSGRFASSRGGFRNESFRGRGNFGGGRTYVRSDSFRGRGNFSVRRVGEGYQPQARGGRGVPHSSGPSQTTTAST